MNRHHSSSSLHGARQAVAWKLMLKEPSSHARYAEYQQQQIVIGRSPDSDLQLQDRFASSSHARLTFTATGLFLLTDLNSANGTYVNGKTINEVYVKAGDQVTIGRTILTICGDEPQPSSSAPDEVTSIMSRPVDAGGTLFSESLLTALNKSSKILLREGNYRESLELVLEQIRSPLEADCAFVLFKDLDQNRWSIEAQAGPMQLPKELQGDATSGSSMDIDKHRELPSLSIARTVIEAGQGYFSANVNEDEQFAKHQSVILQSINTVICVPFVLGKKNILAALYLDRRGLASQNKRPWSAGERDFVESFSRLLTLMLNHSRQQEDLQREIRTRTTLQRYISPQVVNQVLNAKHQHMLGGQEVHASVLFSDIRGFTKMSSNTDPVRLVQQLNEYFSVMSKVIIAHGGYLDKFIGDAIMVVFGVPEMKTDDNKRAILTAIEMQRRLGQLNQEWQTRGWNQFQMGIGINTGRLIVGNIGSTQRMEYTVLGDTVNVSSRLCSVADAGKVIVASTTLEKIGDAFETRLIELPELKGKTQGSVVAYEVVALG